MKISIIVASVFFCSCLVYCDVNRKDTPFISKVRAKRFLFGSIICGLFGCGGAKENARRQREGIRRGRLILLLDKQRICKLKCWDQWTEWGSCDGPCKSGHRRRTRKPNPPAACKNIPCNGRTVESQMCHIDCGRGGKGHGTESRCVCSAGWRGQCCQTRRTCPKPPKPSQGYIEGNQGGVWPAVYDTVISYKCIEGYVRVGNEQRKCLLSEKWSGSNPSCMKVRCNLPDSPKDGHIINPKTEYYFRNNVGYACKLGYHLDGVKTRTCMANTARAIGYWTFSVPQCKPKNCPEPATPTHGTRTGASLFFGAKMTYACNHGYQLMGPKVRTCLSNQDWSGSETKCLVTLCSELSVPANGFMRNVNPSSESRVDSNINFECNPGYILRGDSNLRCLATGKWNGTSPKCEAISCPDPGWPKYGAREDSGFMLGQDVVFTCHNGYILKGDKKVSCLATKKWTGKVPTCEACPKNTFSENNKCLPCPSNSHTITKATAQIKQCICNRGYKGPSGGPCSEITCVYPSLSFGLTILKCEARFGQSCTFGCIDGYILNKGSSVRMCRENGLWDGTEPKCEPCPMNTYKEDTGRCLPCPPQSHTYSDGNVKTDCTCNKGWTGPPGGLCTDLNECKPNNGLGTCEQVCYNNLGSYTCGCTIPGYKIAADGHKCKAEKQCNNLTVSDAPDHGGLICHWYREENSHQCTVRCNPGYELPARINAYETCGPTTGYQWSYKRVDPTSTLYPCIEEFFPDFRVEADSAYFVRECHKLTPKEQEDVKREFAKRLTDEGVCLKRKTKICSMKNVGIICSNVTRRRRGVEEEVGKVDINFQIVVTRIQSEIRNCAKICPLLKIPKRYCRTRERCLRIYNRFLKGAALYAQKRVKNLYSGSNKNKVAFHAASRNFDPISATLSDVLVDCPNGMKSEDGKCVPCEAGTFYSSINNTCNTCEAGSYQKERQKTECMMCPLGTWSQVGAKLCEDCQDGYYGPGCNSSCSCANGSCNKATGKCECRSGWEGDLCDIDIPGCHTTSCYSSVTCTDVPAPGFGYTCGACPTGLSGDGVVCTPIRAEL